MPSYNLTVSSHWFNGNAYQPMHEHLVLAGLAQRTIHRYLRAARQLPDFYQKTPEQLTEEQTRNWLVYLKVHEQAAYGTICVAFSGIKFFYSRTCQRDWKVLRETKLQNVKHSPK